MNSTKLLEEVESAQLGLGIVRSLVGLDADEAQNAAVKEYQDGNMQLWKSRLARLGSGGAQGPKSPDIPESEKSDDMGHTVSIGNENHYHYSAPAGPPPVQADPNPVTAPTPSPVAVQPQPPAVTPSTTEPTPMSNAAKAGIGAAIVLGATALGAALLRPAVTGTKDTDTDTSVSISIPEEDRIK